MTKKMGGSWMEKYRMEIEVDLVVGLARSGDLSSLL